MRPFISQISAVSFRAARYSKQPGANMLWTALNMKHCTKIMGKIRPAASGSSVPYRANFSGCYFSFWTPSVCRKMHIWPFNYIVLQKTFPAETDAVLDRNKGGINTWLVRSWLTWGSQRLVQASHHHCSLTDFAKCVRFPRQVQIFQRSSWSLSFFTGALPMFA